MTARKCPWCGGENLRITNVMGVTQTISWEDRDCGYREKTAYADPEGSDNYPFISCYHPRQKKSDYIPAQELPTEQKTLGDCINDTRST